MQLLSVQQKMIPSPDIIRETRKAFGLSQTCAATLIHSTLRTWQDWEAGKAKMHAGLWELFTRKASDLKSPQGEQNV